MDYQSKAEAAYGAVFRQFYLPQAGLFREHSPAEFGDRRFSYLWPYIAMFSATNAMLSLPHPQWQYLPRLYDILSGLERYWQAPGYASYVVSEGGGSRFYDDNAWVGIELLSAYAVLKDRALLDRAQGVFAFVVTGWSDDLGGGLFWREDERATKNTCSNGPAVVLGLQLYQATRDERYLQWAVRIYEWTIKNLRGAHGLYYDNIDGRGDVDPATYTYNTGIMIQAQMLLFEITREHSYYQGALDLARRSLHVFAPLINDQRFFPATPWFNAVLFRGYLAVQLAGGDGSLAGALLANLEHGWDHARDVRGLLWPDWSGAAKSTGFASLLDQAPVAEIYALAAGLSEDDNPAPAGPGQLAQAGGASLAPAAADQPAAGQPALSPLGTRGLVTRGANEGTFTTPRYGSVTLTGPAYACYDRLGGPGGVLGFPVTGAYPAVASAAGTQGYVLRLEGSRLYPPQVAARLGGPRCGAGLYWSERTGPHATYLATGACYESFGGTGGLLGFPTSERAPAKPSPFAATGYVQRFEAGSIYESQAYGAHPVAGPIAGCYESLGGTGGRLGFPMTDVAGDFDSDAPPGTLRQRFEGGWITYRPGVAAQAVYED